MCKAACKVAALLAFAACGTMSPQEAPAPAPTPPVCQPPSTPDEAPCRPVAEMPEPVRL